MSSSSQMSKIVLPETELELLRRKGYVILEQLNGGSFSKVCKARNVRQNLLLAVKIIDLEKTSLEYRNKFLPRELYTLKKLRHRYIIQVFDIFTIRNRIYIFMDLADGGDIIDLLKSGALKESLARLLYRHISEALHYIHSKGIAHRDIKCENVLLNRSKTVAKLTDFGFSRTCFDNTTGKRLLSDTYCGSAAYVAPEVLKARPYNAIQSDVWSLGVVLYVMVNNRLPFKESDLKVMLRNQCDKNYHFDNKSLTADIKDLIAKQLEPNANLRLTMRQVLQHRWLNTRQ